MEDRFEALVVVLTRLKLISSSSLYSLDVFSSAVWSLQTLNKFSLKVLCFKTILSDLSLLPCEFPLGLSSFEQILNWTEFSSRKLSLVVL